MTSFHYFDLPTLLTRLRYLPNGYFQPEFIDEGAKAAHAQSSVAKGPFGPFGSRYLAWLSQHASFSAQPMDGRVRDMGAVAAHTSTVFCARTWLSQQLSHVSVPRLVRLTLTCMGPCPAA